MTPSSDGHEFPSPLSPLSPMMSNPQRVPPAYLRKSFSANAVISKESDNSKFPIENSSGIFSSSTQPTNSPKPTNGPSSNHNKSPNPNSSPFPESLERSRSGGALEPHMVTGHAGAVWALKFSHSGR